MRLTALIMTFVLLSSFAQASKKIKLPYPKLMHELSLVLKEADDLHKALIAQEDEEFDVEIRDVFIQIDRVAFLIAQIKRHHGQHIQLVIESAKSSLNVALSSYGENRRQALESAFTQMVNLTRVYQLDDEYGIYFCSRDRTSWVQSKKRRAKNPFRPDTLLNCGIRTN